MITQLIHKKNSYNQRKLNYRLLNYIQDSLHIENIEKEKIIKRYKYFKLPILYNSPFHPPIP